MPSNAYKANYIIGCGLKRGQIAGLLHVPPRTLYNWKNHYSDLRPTQAKIVNYVYDELTQSTLPYSAMSNKEKYDFRTKINAYIKNNFHVL